MDILPHRLAADAAWKRPVILLNDPGDNSRYIQLIKSRASKLIQKEFFDVIDAKPDYPIAPTYTDIHDIWIWSKYNKIDLGNIIVTCYGGISRSSAVAYMIACSLGMSPNEAIQNLNINKHYPNIRILSYAGKILGNADFILEGIKFILKADRLFQEQLRSGTI